MALLHAYCGANHLTLLVLIVALLAPGIWASTRTARILQRDDPGVVVVDEVLGQWVTLLGATAFVWKSFAAGFLLFRIFDIWKPWPVRSFERLPEGVGIVADDLAAGIYGALILYIGGIFRLY
jgi:phosphatidylglycerophosphatase A